MQNPQTTSPSQDQSIELSSQVAKTHAESPLDFQTSSTEQSTPRESSASRYDFLEEIEEEPSAGYKPPIQYGESTGFIKPSIKEQKEAKLAEELKKIDEELKNGWYSYYICALYLMIAKSTFLAVAGIVYLQDYSFVLHGVFGAVAAWFVLSSLQNKNSTKAYYGLILGIVGIALLMRALYATYHYMGAADDRKKFNGFVFRVLVASALYLLGHIYAPYKVKTLMQKREVCSKEAQSYDSILNV